MEKATNPKRRKESEVISNNFSKDSKIDFNNQSFYIGIDVHKKNWAVTISTSEIQIETRSMNPSAEGLNNYVTKKYPGGRYYSVYEAGFCGFWIHRELEAGGIINKVVNPADVPTRYNERTKKTDVVDSRKLSRELSKGESLKGIYVPGEKEEALRGLSRQRKQLSKEQARVKNRIKSSLMFMGVEFPENYQLQHWSRNFINHLRNREYKREEQKTTIEGYLSLLEEIRKIQAEQTKKLRNLLNEDEKSKEIIGYLQSVPGIGITTAITLYTEIMDIERFGNFNKLVSYVGFAPATSSSGEKERVVGLSKQQNRFLRNLVIEAAWIAVKKDPALMMSFGEYCRRMSKQQAIIKIAKRLLSRIMYVWRNKTNYVNGVVGQQKKEDNNNKQQ